MKAHCAASDTNITGSGPGSPSAPETRQWVSVVRGCGLPLATALALSIAGCGGGTTTQTGAAATRPATARMAAGAGVSNPAARPPRELLAPAGASEAPAPANSANASTASGPVVASVAGTPITADELAHWSTITQALSGGGTNHRQPGQRDRDKALGFLITDLWMLQEATARGITPSTTQIREHLEEVVGKTFKTRPQLLNYLHKAREAESDLQTRGRLELTENQIAKQVTATAHTPTERKAALASFQRAFQARWKARTTCRSPYLIEDCNNYHQP
jgi:hypothetical protein